MKPSKTPSKTQKFPCEECGRPIVGRVCPECKTRIRQAEIAAANKRQREQAARGLVGDERHAEYHRQRFDDFAASVRAAAGNRVGA